MENWNSWESECSFPTEYWDVQLKNVLSYFGYPYPFLHLWIVGSVFPIWNRWGKQWIPVRTITSHLQISLVSPNWFKLADTNMWINNSSVWDQELRTGNTEDSCGTVKHCIMWANLDWCCSFKLKGPLSRIKEEIKIISCFLEKVLSTSH